MTIDGDLVWIISKTWFLFLCLWRFAVVLMKFLCGSVEGKIILKFHLKCFHSHLIRWLPGNTVPFANIDRVRCYEVRGYVHSDRFIPAVKSEHNFLFSLLLVAAARLQ